MKGLVPRPCETIFGHRLDDVRRARAWTIEYFALHCRVSLRTMEEWLHCRAEPLIGYAFKTALALGYDVEDLADPSLATLPKQRREDAPGEWTFEPKGSVNKTQFGATVREAIFASGRTIKDFAEVVDVHRNAVGKWCTSAAEPRITTAMRAAHVLGLSLHGLCEGRAIPRSR
jgi:transcriptional regulator with XRE-family HTH domain